MKFSAQLIDGLKEALNKPLPGEDAQYIMAPSYRPQLTPAQIAANRPKIGGVLLLLYEKDGFLNIVFTQRKEYQGVHSAQMSFPGGKKDAADEDIIQTALRETKEEIGVEPERIEIIGQLTELYIPPSNFLIYPVVGFSKDIGQFEPQKREVEKIVEIPLSFFLDKKNINEQTEIKLFNNNVVRVPAYIYNQHIIWGATAIILGEFTYIVERL